MPEPLVPDWELYDTTMKCGAAKRALDAAMAKAAKKLVAEIKKRKLFAGDNDSIGMLIASYRDTIVLPVMVKYSEYGATDTEPRYHSGQGLINAVKDHFYIPRKSRVPWGRYL